MAQINKLKQIVLGLSLVFLLSSTGAQAAISGRLDSLVHAAMRLSNVPVTGTARIDTTTVKGFVNQSISQVCSDFPAIALIDTASVDSVHGYATLDTMLIALRNVYQIVSIDDKTGEAPQVLVPLEALPEDYDAKLKAPVVSDAIQNKETVASVDGYKIHGFTFEVWPRWSRGDTATFKVEYYAVDTALTANSSATRIPPKYRWAIIWWTCYQIEKLQGDEGSAAQFYAQYERLRLQNGFGDRQPGANSGNAGGGTVPTTTE